MFNIDNYFSEEIFEFLKDAMADVSRESKEVGDRIIPYFVKMITKLNDFREYFISFSEFNSRLCYSIVFNKLDYPVLCYSHLVFTAPTHWAVVLETDIP